MKKSPLLTKRSRALQELEHASQAIGHALSLLGGRTRHKPFVVTRQFIARQYIESLVTRLMVVRDLIVIDEPLELREVKMSPAHAAPYQTKNPIEKKLHAPQLVALRDEFESTYDKERNPQC